MFKIKKNTLNSPDQVMTRRVGKKELLKKREIPMTAMIGLIVITCVRIRKIPITAMIGLIVITCVRIRMNIIMKVLAIRNRFIFQEINLI